MSSEQWKTLTALLAVALVSSNAYWLLFQPEPTAPLKLNFAYQVGFHYGVSVVMDHFNMVEELSGNRIHASYFKISGGSAINEAIVAGSVDFAQMGSAPAIKGVAQGIGTKILASFGSKEHEMFTWRTDIHTLEDLSSGDLVAVVKPYSIEHVGLIKAYIDMGRSKEEADEISVFLSHSDAYQLMTERQIDGDFTGVPYSTLYKENSEYHQVTCDTEIWGVPLAGGVFIARVDLPGWAVDVVLQAWEQSLQWIKANPKEASRIIGAAYDYDEEEAWRLWQETGITWDSSYGLNVLEQQADIMHRLNIIDRPLTSEELLFPQAPGGT